MSQPNYSRVTSRKLRHAKLMEPVRNCPWRVEEEQRLLAAVERLGANCDWNIVAQTVMTRDSQECMTRWCKLTGSSIPSEGAGAGAYPSSSAASRNWDGYRQSVSGSSAPMTGSGASRRYDGAYHGALSMGGFEHSAGLSDMELMQMYVMEDADVVRR